MSEIKNHKTYTFSDPDSILFPTSARFVRESDYLSVLRSYKEDVEQLVFEKGKVNDAVVECIDICDRVKKAFTQASQLDAFSYGLNKLAKILTRTKA